jgi:hypothetical protein
VSCRQALIYFSRVYKDEGFTDKTSTTTKELKKNMSNFLFLLSSFDGYRTCKKLRPQGGVIHEGERFLTTVL